MPRLKVDYSKTVIYKIVCNDLEIKDLYVGSTTEFTKRKNCHKCACNNENNQAYMFKVYQTIREHGGWENWSMIEIEKFSCKDGNEARAKERFWYEELEAKLNMCFPIRNKKEYMIQYEATEERKKKKEIHQKKYDATEERIKYKKEYMIQYEATNEDRKEYRKKYVEEHAEERKEYMKKYDEEHKEEHKQKARERYAKKRAETQ